MQLLSRVDVLRREAAVVSNSRLANALFMWVCGITGFEEGAVISTAPLVRSLYENWELTKNPVFAVHAVPGSHTS